MSGSMEVNAKLKGWELITHKMLEQAMDSHIKGSENFAKANHRWQDQTGAATGALSSQTESNPAKIESAVYGDIDTNLYLDQAWFFQGRYKIIERARSNNITALWARIRAIMKA